MADGCVAESSPQLEDNGTELVLAGGLGASQAQHVTGQQLAWVVTAHSCDEQSCWH